MHVCFQNILFGSVGVTSTHLSLLMHSKQVYLPAVLNNNGDKLKKKKRERERERERERWG